MIAYGEAELETSPIANRYMGRVPLILRTEMLRHFLYGLILVAGTYALTTIELLHYHEAVLVSGVLAIVVMLLVEPPGAKLAKAQNWLLALISLYGFGLKLPLLLEGRMNYYLMYFIVFVLIIVVNFGSLLLPRKQTSASSE